MSSKDNDKLYAILLDMQKQLGAVSRETGEQSETLKSILKKLDETTDRVDELEDKQEKTGEIIANFKGKVAVISVVFSVISGAIINFIRKELGI